MRWGIWCNVTQRWGQRVDGTHYTFDSWADATMWLGEVAGFEVREYDERRRGFPAVNPPVSQQADIEARLYAFFTTPPVGYCKCGIERRVCEYHR